MSRCIKENASTTEMYREIGHSQISVALLELAQNSRNWLPYYNFEALPVHPVLWSMDPFLSNLSKKHEFQAGVLRLPERTCYNWHTDTDRKVSVNMLLKDTRSSCLFMGKPGVSFHFYELHYMPYTYYAFDTQTPHMVLNHEGPRYMFSLEFLGNSRNLTFDKLCADFKD